jgi:hypothetical protein
MMQAIPPHAAFRPWQARENHNMERFCGHFEIPSFCAPDVFDGWRVAAVTDVAKLFRRTDARIRALATLALWCHTPLHDLPSLRFGVLNHEVAARVRAGLLRRSNRMTLYVDARHVLTLALRRPHSKALALIGDGSPELQCLAGVFANRQQRQQADKDEGYASELEWE